MKKQHLIGLFIFFLFLFITSTFSVFATAEIEAILGEETTSIMLQEIESKVNEHAVITEARIKAIIYSTANQYGLELTEEVEKSIYENINVTVRVTSETDGDFWEHFSLFIAELKALIEETFPALKDETFTLPSFDQINTWVDNFVFYLKRNIFPLFAS